MSARQIGVGHRGGMVTPLLDASWEYQLEFVFVLETFSEILGVFPVSSLDSAHREDEDNAKDGPVPSNNPGVQVLEWAKECEG